jgi:hypothetical protein
MRRNGLICKKTGMMKIQKTPFKADIVGNQTRNQLAKISSNATIKILSGAGTREATNGSFYLQL